MKNSILIIFLLGTMISLNSCKNKETEMMLEQISSSSLLVKESEKLLFSIDTADVNTMVRYSTKQSEIIQNHHKDTVSKEQAIFLSDIIANRRSFVKMLKQQNSLIKDMFLAKTQLFDLKKDVEKELLDTATFNSYFDTERKAIVLLSKSAESINKWNESSSKRFNTMKPKIEEYINNLEK